MRRAVLSVLVLAACADVEKAAGPGEPWTTAPEMPAARHGAAVTALGTRLAVVGGFMAEGTIARDVLVLDTLTDTWSALPEAPVAWADAGLASAGGALYLLGGIDGEQKASADGYVLPSGSLVWHALAPMPRPLARGAAAVVVAPPRVILIGGENEHGPHASVISYNFIEDDWTELPALPAPRTRAAAMRQFDGTLIVVGGLDAEGAPIGDVAILRPNAEAWEAGATMPTPRGDCAFGVALGHLVCAGGIASAGPSTAVETYDPVADIWAMQPVMPSPRIGARGTVIGQQLYVVGGAEVPAGPPESSVLVFSLLDTLPRP